MTELSGAALIIGATIAGGWILRIWLGRYASYVLANIIAAAALIVLSEMADANAGYGSTPLWQQLLLVQFALFAGGMAWMHLASPRPGEFSRPFGVVPATSSVVERSGSRFPMPGRERDAAPRQRFTGPWANLAKLRSSATTPSPVQVERSGPSRNFFIRYWRGQISLVHSFWIVMPAIATFSVVFAFAVGKIIEVTGIYDPYIIFNIWILCWTALIALTIWKIVGLWRSATCHMRASRKIGGTMFWGGMVKFLLVLAAIYLAVDIKQAFLQINEAYAVAFTEDPLVPDYALRVMRDGTELEVSGGFKNGLSEDLRRLLTASPRIAVIHLDSPGGRTREAMQVRDLIQERGLATYVAHECLGACTVAFAAGKERWLGPTGTLGFDEARTISKEPVPKHLPKRELLEAIDWALLSPNHLDQRFVELALATSETWLRTPTTRELLDTGAATGMAPPDKFAMSGFGTGFTLARAREGLPALYPTLATMRQREPGKVEAMIQKFHRMYLDGSSMDEAAAMIRAQLTPEFDTSLALVDDETLLMLAKLNAETYRHLVSVNIVSCYKYITDRSTDISRLLTPQLLERTQEITARMGRGVQLRPRLAKPQPGEAWQEAMALLKATPQGQDIHLFNVPPTLGEYADYCWLYASLYDAIGQLAPEKGAALVRQLMSRKQ